MLWYILSRYNRAALVCFLSYVLLGDELSISPCPQDLFTRFECIYGADLLISDHRQARGLHSIYTQSTPLSFVKDVEVHAEISLSLSL